MYVYLCSVFTSSNYYYWQKSCEIQMKFIVMKKTKHYFTWCLSYIDFT